MTDYNASGHQIGLEIASAKQNITLLRRQLQTGRIDFKYFDERLDALASLLETVESERRNTREQQRVTKLYEVSKVIGSSLNLQTVLDQVMDAIIQLTEAERGFLMLLDDDGNLDVRVARDFDQETLSSNDIAFSRTITRQVFDNGEPVVTTNAQEDPRYAGQASIIAHAMRSIMASPLRARGQTIGVVYVDNRIRTGLFADEDLRALDAFGSQAGVAIENARLYSETDALLQERLEELKLLQWIDRQFNESLESEKIMNLVLEWASRLGEADSASIGFVDDESKVIRWAASYGESHLFVTNDTLPFSNPLVRRVLDEQEFAMQVDHDTQETLLCIPVRLENRIVALVFFRAARSDAFDENVRSLISRVADRAAIALQNGRLYEAVKAADRAKTEFVSVVAHELKVPMTSIQGYASMLERIGELNAQQQSFVQTVVDNVERMKVLVNDLSDISRIESGQLHIDIKPVELMPRVDQARKGVLAQIQERGHTLVEDIDDDLPLVLADGARLVQVLVNLLSNAYKYTPDNGTITLRVKDQGEHVMISVQDTGVGMTPEQVERLGTKFVRFDDNDHVAKQSGTGLGFAITRNLIELMNGELHIESEANIGSTFMFTIPTAQE